MTTITVNTEREFNQLFNFNFQAWQIRVVNGIAVNVHGSTAKNELFVSNKHVYLENYSVAEQSTNLTFLKAPFTITF